MKKLVMVAIALLALAGCGGGNKQKTQYTAVEKHAKGLRAYIPHNDVELRNYNEAQKLYDSPSSIIWCTTTWGNPSAPMVTIPVTGKLTSSSTTFFSPDQMVDHGNYSWSVVQSRSIDGLYHPNPPQYRYGFTPGGQYVDFFNMPTLCTTALTRFQRQQTKLALTVDSSAAAATAKAEQALKSGDQAAAQRILEGANLGG